MSLNVRAKNHAGPLAAASPLHAASFNVSMDTGRIGTSTETGVGHSSPPVSSAHLTRDARLIDPDPPMSPKPLPSKIGRRAAPRLRLSLPGQLVAVERVHRCILLNLSRTGAQVAILDALREGEGAILKCGAIDHFAVVTRSEFGLNALEFEEPLTDAQVIEIRHYHENFEERERRALVETARKWVNGDIDDDRAI